MKPFEFEPNSEEEVIFIKENNEFADNTINVLKIASDTDREILAGELPDEIICIIMTRACDNEDYEIMAFLKPIIEERGMTIPK